MKILLLTSLLILGALTSLSAQEVPFEKEEQSRLGVELHFGLVGRLPLDDSFYNLWRDLAIGPEPFDQSDLWPKKVSANWPDYISSFTRLDLDYRLSDNLSIGFSALTDPNNKSLVFSDQTDNWTGDGSGGLEDHWTLKRRLRFFTYNIGPNFKFNIPAGKNKLTLSYLYGWSYLRRSTYKFSYFNQLTGTGEKGFLGIVFASNGNLTRLRFTGDSNIHKIEFALTKPPDRGTIFGVRIGYQFLKMDNIKYSVEKFGAEDYDEARSFFIIGHNNDYVVGEGGDYYLNDATEKFDLDLSSVYISFVIGFNFRKE